jgi:class 3 adenylate cyclase
MHCGSKLEAKTQPAIDTRLSSLQQSAPKGLQEKMATARSEVRGERRPVTILFTDIVGSTAIVSQLDPEDWREIVGGTHRRSRMNQYD